jgi:hypothetical protein
MVAQARQKRVAFKFLSQVRLRHAKALRRLLGLQVAHAQICVERRDRSYWRKAMTMSSTIGLFLGRDFPA